MTYSSASACFVTNNVSLIGWSPVREFCASHLLIGHRGWSVLASPLPSNDGQQVGRQSGLNTSSLQAHVCVFRYRGGHKGNNEIMFYINYEII